MNETKTAAFAVVMVLIVVGVATPMLSDDTEAETVISPLDEEYPEYGVVWMPIIFIIGMAVSAGIGYVAGEHFAEPAGNQEDIYRQLREIYGEKTMDTIDSVVGLISSILPADTTLWTFTHDYWNRAVELSVADVWALGDTYNPDAVVGKALLRENLENYIYNWQSAIDKSINNITSVRDQMVGDCYGNMELSISWSGDELMASSNTSEPFDFDLLQVVRNTTAGSTVWIDARAEDEGGSYNEDTSATIYNFGQSSVRLVKVAVYENDSGGNSITIPAGGTYVMPSEFSGMYRIETSGATLAGPFSKAASDRAADVIGGLVISGGDERVYVVPDGNNVLVTNTSGASWSSNTLRYEVSYTGLNNNGDYSVLVDGDTYNIVRDWNNLIQGINDAINDAATSGEVIWGIFDVAEESNSFLSPSSITRSVEGISLSTVEQQAIYIQAMMYIADYWENHGGELGNAEFITNIESVDLVVYGDIYYNGELWMENAVFTPYLTVSSAQTLTTGSTVQWSGPGFAMVWAQVDQFSQWNGDTTSGSYYLLDLNSGYSMDIERMTKGGQVINEITLTPTVIDRYTVDPEPPSDLDDPVQVLDAGNLIMLILIELAVIIFLLGYIWGQPVWGAVIALIVLVIGILFSGAIAALLL